MKIRYPDIQPDIKGWNTNLYTPPNVVSMQEHHQIELRLDGWAKALAVCDLQHVILITRHLLIVSLTGLLV